MFHLPCSLKITWNNSAYKLAAHEVYCFFNERCFIFTRNTCTPCPPPPPQKKTTPNNTASLVIFVCLFFDLCINGVILVLSDNIQRYACDLNGIFKIVHGIKVAVVWDLPCPYSEQGTKLQFLSNRKNLCYRRRPPHKWRWQILSSILYICFFILCSVL